MSKKFISIIITLSMFLSMTLVDNVKTEAKAKKYAFSKNSIILEKGKSKKLSFNKYTMKKMKKVIKWRSSNSKIAKVNKKGKVKALKIGKAKIIATIKVDGKKKDIKCTIKVKKKESKIENTPTANPSETSSSQPLQSTSPSASVTPTIPAASESPTNPQSITASYAAIGNLIDYDIDIKKSSLITDKETLDTCKVAFKNNQHMLEPYDDEFFKNNALIIGVSQEIGNHYLDIVSLDIKADNDTLYCTSYLRESDKNKDRIYPNVLTRYMTIVEVKKAEIKEVNKLVYNYKIIEDDSILSENKQLSLRETSDGNTEIIKEKFVEINEFENYSVNFSSFTARTKDELDKITNTYDELLNKQNVAKDGNIKSSVFSDLFKEYDEEFFKDNVLIVQVPDIYSRGFGFTSSKLTVDKGTLNCAVGMKWNLPPGYLVTCDVVYYFAIHEVDKKVMEGVDKINYETIRD